MHYYIINKNILEFVYELDPDLYNIEIGIPDKNNIDYEKIYKLSTEQSNFYIEHMDANLDDILDLNITSNLPHEETFEDEKNSKLSIIQSEYQSTISQGYTDPIEGITLAVHDFDQAAFTKLLTFIQLAQSLGQSINDIPIADINSNIRTFSVLNLQGLLLRYGFFCQTIWTRLVTLQNAIKTANTQEELNQINW